MSSRDRRPPGVGAAIIFGIVVGLAVAAASGVRADQAQPAGVWVTARGSDRLFLVLYADGRYRMARARAVARTPLAVQWDVGTYAVGAGWVTLSAQPAGCKQPLGGEFQFRFVGRHLRLEGQRQTYMFGRLPAQADVSVAPGTVVFGCFEGDRFVPLVDS